MKTFINYVYNEIEYIIFSTLMIIIILPKAVQLFFYLGIIFVLLLKNGFKIKMNRVTMAMILLFSVHGFSIIYNIAFVGNSWDRVFAAINTALLWFVSAVYYSYYSNDNNNIDIKKIGKYCFVNIIIIFALAMVSIYLYYFKENASYQFFGKILFETTYLNDKPKIKFFGLNDFSNMNLICIMLMSLLSYFYIKDKKILLKLIYIFMISTEVILIHSRSGMVLFTICIFSTFVAFMKSRYKKTIVFLVIALAILVGLINYDLVIQIFLDKIIYGNKSSTGFRALLIETSLEEVITQSPIWGMGVKRFLYEGYPLGSHSTYIGFLYKTGIIGALIGIYIFFKSNFKIIVKSKNIIIMAYLVCFLILFVLEDVDGANWCIILYFSTLAMLKKQLNIQKPNNENLRVNKGDN